MGRAAAKYTDQLSLVASSATFAGALLNDISSLPGEPRSISSKVEKQVPILAGTTTNAIGKPQ
jgi:hypothetical protein